MATSHTHGAEAASSGIGAALRAAREARGVSLTDLRARTKIDLRHLAALEADRFADLPPFPFARGFLRTYALELGLDPEPLVARLAEAMAAPKGVAVDDWRRLEGAITPARPPSPLRRVAITAGSLTLIVGIVLVVFFIQQLREFDRPVPVATPAAREAGPTSVPTSVTAATPAPEVAATSSETHGITVEVQAIGRSWIRVQAGEGPLFEGFVTAGEIRQWQSTGSLTIRVGNASAVVVTVNGRAVGALGRRGEVVSRTFRKDAIP